MQDSPGLDVGDDSFDLVADLVDGPVVGLVVWVEGKFGGVSFRGDQCPVRCTPCRQYAWVVTPLPGGRRVARQAVRSGAGPERRVCIRPGGWIPRPGFLRGCRPPGRSAP